MISFFYQLVSCLVLINSCCCYKVHNYFRRTAIDERDTDSTVINTGTAGRLWAIKLKNLDKLSRDAIDIKAEEISSRLQMENLGQIGKLSGYYTFAADNFSTSDIEMTLRNQDDIDKFEQQRLIKVSTRNDNNAPKFSDPLIENQWHLYNRKKVNEKRLLDCNVTNVWSYNIQGQGIVVSFLDDGVDWRHKDLEGNYFGKGSFNFIDDIKDPTPSKFHQHGTGCAGVASALAGNTVCGVGVAYSSKFSAMRMLPETLTPAKIAEAFNYQLNDNHIYSSSWGPIDDGKTAENLNWLIGEAFVYGASKGRNSYGTIFVFAAGNGGTYFDDCSYDQYVSSIYVIPITSVTEYGVTPIYAERCTSIMTSTLSGPHQPPPFGRNITTTAPLNRCTNKFSGTSASAPLGSGIIALMLQARPCLYWRDVHHIIAMTSSHVMLSGEVELFDSYNNTEIPSQFYKNHAGYTYNDYHGFGFLDAWKVVNAARVWKPVPKMTQFEPNCNSGGHTISLNYPVELSCQASKTDGMATIENVVVTLTVDHEYRGMLEYTITCPSGTESVIDTRPRDTSSRGQSNNFLFRTVKCWGESPVGVFKFKVRDTRKVGNAGKFRNFKITVYGSAMTLPELRDRWNTVEKSYSDGGDQLRENLQSSSLSCPAIVYQTASVDPLLIAMYVLIGVYVGLLIIIAVFWLVRYIKHYNKTHPKEFSDE